MFSKIKRYLTFVLVFAGIFILSATVWADDSRIDFSLTFTGDGGGIFGMAYHNIGWELFGSGTLKDPYEGLIHNRTHYNQSYTLVKEVPIIYQNGLNIQMFFDLSEQSKIYLGIGRYDVCYRSIVRDTSDVLYYSNEFKYKTEYAYSLGTKVYLNKRMGLSFGYQTLYGFGSSVVFSLY